MMMFQESSDKLDDNSSGNTDHNEFCLKQHIIAKATKTKLTRAEERASKQAHAALVSLPKLLDHFIDEMIQDQHKRKALDALWNEAREKGEKYTEKQGLLWKHCLDKLGRPHLQLVVPTSYKASVLRLAHRPGHLGRDKTLWLLSVHFFWPSVRKDVTIVFNSCEICQISQVHCQELREESVTLS